MKETDNSSFFCKLNGHRQSQPLSCRRVAPACCFSSRQKPLASMPLGSTPPTDISMDIDTSSYVMTTDNREWVIDNTTYQYSVEDMNNPFMYGCPPNICKALRPQWLTMPALGRPYQERMMSLAQGTTRTQSRKQRIQDDPDITRDCSSSNISVTSRNHRHWYQRHLAPRYRMHYVGRLDSDVVAKFTEELSPLCRDEALVRNLDVISGSSRFNLALVAAEQDATNIRTEAMAVSCEIQMQERVATILRRHQMILEYLLANQHTRLSFTRPLNIPLVFLATQVPNAANVTNRNSISLRTIARPNSTPCTDIAVTLVNLDSLFLSEGKTYIGLNPLLRNRLYQNLWNYELKCWIVVADGLTDKLVRYSWPSCSNACGDQGSGTAQPDSIMQPNPGGTSSEFKDTTRQRSASHNCGIYHPVDISGDSFSDQHMLDVHPDVENEYLKTLGLEESPVLQVSTDAEMDVHPGSAQLNQVSSLYSHEFRVVDNDCRYGPIWSFEVPSSHLSVTGFMLRRCAFVFHPRESC